MRAQPPSVVAFGVGYPSPPITYGTLP